MYARELQYNENKSFFLFGPRGTGKSSWVRGEFQAAAYVDLLEAELSRRLAANPQRLMEYVGTHSRVVIDEVQKIPSLLDEVHRLVENQGIRFVLTGSSARKLKRAGVNLLAGRALTQYLYPLTSVELGSDFRLDHALRYGTLPAIHSEPDPDAFLNSYVQTYLKEEIEMEGLTRNVGSFSRFLETISFSQGSVLNLSEVSRESGVARKTVEEYVSVLEDLLLAERVPVFTRRARRKMISHPKFFLFDAGVYRTLRPRGPLDAPEEIEGAALETVVFNELRALNHYGRLGYRIFFWRSTQGLEVDFILYGERGLHAIEVKRSRQVRSQDLKGLKAFLRDYPEASALLLCGEQRERTVDGIRVLPIDRYLPRLNALVA